ncbi:MAG: ATP-dependent Clp protease ATP-binding subunit [Propionibacteriaceae bacterium]|jgi:ATP-dependent Clp protease ATP-binding subunit ClpC|nr:ATP-dependent Clp protease ATP-binding subunit [Propionibacteriaceae bacterium]
MNEQLNIVLSAAKMIESRSEGDPSFDQCFLAAVLDSEVQPYAEILTHAGITRSLLAATLSDSKASRRTALISSSELLVAAQNMGKALGVETVRVPHFLLAILAEPDWPTDIWLTSIAADARVLRARIAVTAGEEDRVIGVAVSTKSPVPPVATTLKLDSFGVNLNTIVLQGRSDPVVGRDSIIQQVLETLMRRRKSNPLLIGEPGTGKTAIVEGLARRIATGLVSPPIIGRKVFSLDLASVVSGTKYRGEFEARFEKILNGIIGNPDYIVFIDEIHTLASAGGAEGALNAATLLKPHLARGDIQLIGATTGDEYQLHIATDPALARRFIPIEVPELTQSETLAALQSLRSRYEQYHRVHIDDDALDAAIHYSARYLPDRAFPDKALDLLDSSCAKIALGVDAHDEVDGAKVTAHTIAVTLSRDIGLESQEIEGSSRWLESLSDSLCDVVLGQAPAIRIVVDTVTRHRLGLTRQGGGMGSFLFSGPTCCGKQTLARALALQLYGDSKRFLRFSMSEYATRQSVWQFTASAPKPGYSPLSSPLSQVRAKPLSVLFLENIDQADPAVIDVIAEMIADHEARDESGKTVSLEETTIILSTTIPSGLLSDERFGFGPPDLMVNSLAPATSRDGALEQLVRALGAPLVESVDAVVPFSRLGRTSLDALLVRWSEESFQRVRRLGHACILTRDARDVLIDQVSRTGGTPRHLDAAFSQRCEEPLSRLLLRKDTSGSLTVDAVDQQILIRDDGGVVWQEDPAENNRLTPQLKLSRGD